MAEHEQEDNTVAPKGEPAMKVGGKRVPKHEHPTKAIQVAGTPTTAVADAFAAPPFEKTSTQVSEEKLEVLNHPAEVQKMHKKEKQHPTREKAPNEIRNPNKAKTMVHQPNKFQ